MVIVGLASASPCSDWAHISHQKRFSRLQEEHQSFGDPRKDKKKCLEGESNSHLRITQAELGHIYDR
jgi:hypothetical protein